MAYCLSSRVFRQLYGSSRLLKRYLPFISAIKSRIQTDGFPSQPDKKLYHGALDCVRKTYAKQGVKGFFKGLVPTLIRSPFANGATFAFYEITMKIIA